MIMGGDRSSMVQTGDRTFSPGDQDLGVSVAQVFSPPYLFADAAGTLKPRPVMEKGAPDEVRYKQQLKIKVSTNIKTVSMFRTGSVTHELHNDYRLVMLNFKNQGSHVIVDMPFKPAQAIPGDYMLFVVDENGTPSQAKHVRLKL
jgi:galactose oxidase